MKLTMRTTGKMKLRQTGPWRNVTMSKAGLVFFIGFMTLMIINLGFVVFGDGETLSISQFLVNTGFTDPITSLVFGMTIGHLWLSMWPEDWEPEQVSHWWRLKLLSALSGAVIFAGLWAIVVHWLHLRGIWSAVFFFLPGCE